MHGFLLTDHQTFQAEIVRDPPIVPDPDGVSQSNHTNDCVSRQGEPGGW